MPVVKEEEFRGTERFQIRRRLGAGAFGVVYEAHDRERNALVALKSLREGNVEALFRLKREFRALADIAHPNLVALHELLAHGDQWFFTMDLVDGVNFLNWVRGEAETARALPDDPTTPAAHDAPAPSRAASRHAGRPDRIRSALRQAVVGMQALHRAGQLHRDIKPSNVLITREGRLVLLDFGLVTDLTLSGSKRSISVVGTPAYMSPEQSSGRPVSEASDWYSLGVMLFEALTGRWPFTGSFIEMAWEKNHNDSPLPREMAPDTPEDLNALCRDLLRRDPQTRPTGDQILARLGGVQAATWEPDDTSGAQAILKLPFVGREAHLASLRSAFEAARAGRTVVMRLHGTSGTGKTALARHFLHQIRKLGAVVLAGRCYERESVPYKALDSLVDALSQFLKNLPAAQANEILPRDVHALARLFPVLRRVEAIAGARRKVLEIPDSQELRRRAFTALRELFTRLAEQHDLALFIDDLQWGDVDSATLLADLLSPPRPPSLLLIACYRTEETDSSPFLQRFLSPGTAADPVEVQELIVGELSAREARDLTAALLGSSEQASESRIEEIARESQGNAFFLSELVRYSQAGVDLSEGDASPPAPSRGLSARVTKLEEVIRSRVRRLPEGARRLLEILAVAGKPLRPAVAQHAAGSDDRELDAIALLRSRHLIRTRSAQDRDEIEPYHDRIRETVVAQLAQDVLKSHHRRLALALEGSGTTDPEALALHFQEAGEPERAAEYSAAAAARASDALAFDRAARLYRLALELGPSGQSEARRVLCVRLGDALSNAGRSAEAAEAYLGAVAGAQAADALELRRRAAEQLLISGHVDEGLATLASVIESVGMRMPKTPRTALLSLLWHRALLALRGTRFHERDATQVSAETLTRIDVCWSAAKGLILSEPIRGLDFLARQLLLALKAGERFRVARSLAMEIANSASFGGRRRQRTQKLIETATELANRIEHPYAIGFTMSLAGVAAYLEGRWKDSRELTERAGAFLREHCLGVWWELDNSNFYSLLVLYYLGELKQLQDKLPGVLKEAEDRGDLYAATNVRTRISCLTRLIQDQPALAREELKEAIALWPRSAFRLQNLFELFGQVECSLYTGDANEAWEHLASRWPAVRRSLMLRLQSVLINSFYLRGRSAIAAAGAEGGDSRLLEVAEKAARRIEREKMPWGNALARLMRAGISSVSGERDAAVSLLESAEKQLAAVDMALHAAAARRRRGELLAGGEGAALVAAADEWLRGQGIRNPARIVALLAPGSRT
jgi:hypothetical protein